MYEEAEPVRRWNSTLGSGYSQSSAPPSQAPPVNQGGPNGRYSHGDDGPEGIGAFSESYEEAERVYYTINPADLSASVNGTRLLQSSIESESPPAGDGAEDTRRYVMDTSTAVRSYRVRAGRRRVLCCGFLFGVLAALVIVGLAMILLIMFTQKEHDRTAAMEQGLHKMSAIPYGPLGPSPTPTPRSASMSTAASCAKDYTEFREICYKKSKTHKDFSEAEATCREDGGTLAMAKDASTNAFLVSTLDKVGRHTTNCCWIGLHDRRHEGSFEWVDGTPLGNFSLWGVAQPGGEGQDCVLSTDWVGQPTWADFDCRYSFFFICQIIP